MLCKFYPDGRSKYVDLYDMYNGCTLFLVAGSPTLADENLELLKTPGILTMTINNAATMVNSDFWISGDRAECYAEYIIKNPSILKFVNYSRRDDTYYGTPWKLMPSTLFYSCKEYKEVNHKTLLHRRPHLVWWSNTWWTALQLAYHLGFRTICTVGAEFNISADNQYAWESSLTPNEVRSNKALYDKTALRMNQHRNTFISQGLTILNCCKTSKLCESYGYIPLDLAVKNVYDKLPKIDTSKLPHSKRGTDGR